MRQHHQWDDVDRRRHHRPRRTRNNDEQGERVSRTPPRSGGTTSLRCRPASRVDDAAVVAVSATIAHNADFCNRVRGGRAGGHCGTLRAGTAHCHCEWTCGGIESLAVARQAHADRVRTETLRALAQARVG